MSVFGSIIPNDVIEDAVISTLRKWMPTYLSEVERQLGLEPPYYKRPEYGAYTVRADFDKFPEEMLPLVVVVSPGLTDDPPKRGRDKTYSGRFQINVTCIVSSTDQTSTRHAAMRYGAAATAALIQNQSLDHGIGDRVRGIDWIGQRNREITSPEPADRTLWGIRQVFLVEVDDILSKGGGPVDPDPQPDPTAPWPDPPTADTVTVDIEKEPITP